MVSNLPGAAFNFGYSSAVPATSSSSSSSSSSVTAIEVSQKVEMDEKERGSTPVKPEQSIKRKISIARKLSTNSKRIKLNEVIDDAGKQWKEATAKEIEIDLSALQKKIGLMQPQQRKLAKELLTSLPSTIRKDCTVDGKALDDQIIDIVRKGELDQKGKIKLLKDVIDARRIAVIKVILETDISFAEDNEETYECLLSAAKSNPEIATLVLNKNPRTKFHLEETSELDYYFYALALEFKDEQEQLCKLLIEKGFDASLPSSHDDEAICFLAAKGNTKILTQLLSDNVLIAANGAQMMVLALASNQITNANLIKAKLTAINFEFAKSQVITMYFIEVINKDIASIINFLIDCNAVNSQILVFLITQGKADLAGRIITEKNLSATEALWHYIDTDVLFDFQENSYNSLFTEDVQNNIKTLIGFGAEINNLRNSVTMLTVLLRNAFKNFESESEGEGIIEFRKNIKECTVWFIENGADISLKEDNASNAFEILLKLGDGRHSSALIKPFIKYIPKTKKQKTLDDSLVAAGLVSHIETCKILINKGAISYKKALLFLATQCSLNPKQVENLKYFANQTSAFHDEEDFSSAVLSACWCGNFEIFKMIEENSKPKDRNYLCKDSEGFGLLSYIASATWHEEDFPSELFEHVAQQIGRIPRHKRNYTDIVGAYLLLKANTKAPLSMFSHFTKLLPWESHVNISYDFLTSCRVKVQDFAENFIVEFEITLKSNEDEDANFQSSFFIRDLIDDACNELYDRLETTLFITRESHYQNRTSNTLYTGLTDDQMKRMSVVDVSSKELIQMFQAVRKGLQSTSLNFIKQGVLFFTSSTQLSEQTRKQLTADAGSLKNFFDQQISSLQNPAQAKVEKQIEEMMRTPVHTENIAGLNYSQRYNYFCTAINAFLDNTNRQYADKAVKLYFLKQLVDDLYPILTSLVEQQNKSLKKKNIDEGVEELFTRVQGYYHLRASKILLHRIQRRESFTAVSGIPDTYTAVPKKTAAMGKAEIDNINKANEAHKVFYRSLEEKMRKQIPLADYKKEMERTLGIIRSLKERNDSDDINEAFRLYQIFITYEKSLDDYEQFISCQLKKENFYLKLQELLRAILFGINEYSMLSSASSSSSSSTSSSSNSVSHHITVGLLGLIKEFVETCGSGWEDALQRLAEQILKEIKNKNPYVESVEKSAKEREEKHQHEIGKGSTAEIELHTMLANERRDVFRLWGMVWRDLKAKENRDGRAAVAGNEVHYSNAAIVKYGKSYGIPDAESINEKEPWTDEMDTHFKEFFKKEYIQKVQKRASYQINRQNDGKRASDQKSKTKNLQMLFADWFTKNLMNWQKDKYEEIETDAQKSLDDVLGKIKVEYEEILKEASQPIERNKKLEELVKKLKSLSKVLTAYGVGYDEDLVKLNFSYALPFDQLKTNMQSVVSRLVKAAHEYQFKERIYDKDYKLQSWVIREILLNFKVLGAIPFKINPRPKAVPSSSSSSSSSTAAAIALPAAQPPRPNAAVAIPQRARIGGGFLPVVFGGFAPPNFNLNPLLPPMGQLPFPALPLPQFPALAPALFPALPPLPPLPQPHQQPQQNVPAPQQQAPAAQQQPNNNNLINGQDPAEYFLNDD